MTSVDSIGKINWQIETSSSWTKSTQKNSKFFFAPTENFYTMIDFAEKSFTPSLEAFTPNRALKQVSFNFFCFDFLFSNNKINNK